MRFRAAVVVAVVVVLLGGAVASSSAAPAPESTFTRGREISVGEGLACIYKEYRPTNVPDIAEAWCWGDEDDGSFGDGPLTGPFAKPVRVGNAYEVSAGRDFGCLRSHALTVKCWGHDDDGQLGNGNPLGSSNVPVNMVGPSGTGTFSARGLSLGGSTACALSGPRSVVYCWGRGTEGQLGNGTVQDSPIPVAVHVGTALLSEVLAVSVGENHACATTNGGRIYCWGSNQSGQLGTDFVQGQSTVPVTVVGPGGDTARFVGGPAEAGNGFTCARGLNDDGESAAYCWGTNERGQVGDGTFENATVPTVVSSVNGDGDLTGVVEVSAGLTGACARLTSLQVRCWGDEVHGDGTTPDGAPTGASAFPVVVRNPANTGPLRNVFRVSVGESACVVLVNRQVRCWGPGANGTLGNGAPTPKGIPVVVVRNALNFNT